MSPAKRTKIWSLGYNEYFLLLTVYSPRVSSLWKFRFFFWEQTRARGCWGEGAVTAEGSDSVEDLRSVKCPSDCAVPALWRLVGTSMGRCEPSFIFPCVAEVRTFSLIPDQTDDSWAVVSSCCCSSFLMTSLFLVKPDTDFTQEYCFWWISSYQQCLFNHC